MNLKQYFDRVVLINLKRRPDRLAKALAELKSARWPFPPPEVVEAVDGKLFPPPVDWKYGTGAWGCLKSHEGVMQKALTDGTQSLLVIEDDICFVPNFLPMVKKFLQAVPADWDQLMLGGQHINLHGEPSVVKRGVVRCTDCERTHCYAIRGEYMRKLTARLAGGGEFNGQAINDWIMGRDPDMQLAHKVYAPEFFLVGQERGVSDIYGNFVPRKFWNPPGPELTVINLHAPASVVAALQPYGLCTGQNLGAKGGFHQQFEKIFLETRRDSQARVEKLRTWIKLMQWELAAEPSLICTIAHPEATAQLVQAASHWPVHEIVADDVENGLRQLPRRIMTTLLKFRPWLNQRKSPS